MTSTLASALFLEFALLPPFSKFQPKKPQDQAGCEARRPIDQNIRKPNVNERSH